MFAFLELLLMNENTLSDGRKRPKTPSRPDTPQQAFRQLNSDVPSGSQTPSIATYSRTPSFVYAHITPSASFAAFLSFLVCFPPSPSKLGGFKSQARHTSLFFILIRHITLLSSHT